MGAISVVVLWPVLLCLAVNQDYYGRMTPEEEEVRCGHGHFDYGIDECICDEGWKKAGLTDFVDFLKGKCTQFQCSSDHQCQERLGDYASCPIQGWNCYCGWERAFEGSGPFYFGLSAGYSTRSAACQGPLYTLSFWATGYTVWLCSELWKLIFFFMIVMVFFGQTHVRCQCYDPSMFRVVRLIFCWRFQCNGRCTMPPGNINTLRYTWWTLYYDLAWSIYVLDVGIWLYCFLVVLLSTFLVGWAILIWFMVIVALVCSAIAMLVGVVCGAGGSDSGGGDACNCGNCDCDCNCCNGSDANLGDCRCDCCPADAGGGGIMPDFMFYGYTGGAASDGDCCSCKCCDLLGHCCLCYPLARLFQLFPRMPSNMWGGLFGYFCLKTHPLRRQAVYQGGSRFTDFFSFRGSDNPNLRSNDWRNHVAQFLGVRDASQAAPSQFQMIDNRPTRPQGAALDPRPSPSPEVRVIKGRRIVSSVKTFDPESDNCKNSTFEDYKSRDCWICCDSKSEPNWDLWVQCGHLFCSRCSEQMLQRGMPCPLCRRVSYTVKRGKPFHDYVSPEAPA